MQQRSPTAPRAILYRPAKYQITHITRTPVDRAETLAPVASTSSSTLNRDIAMLERLMMALVQADRTVK
ncbi:hypothetical protein FA95DRAFT_1560166 [Auriscalpium vulgare]|uniref:Uncharacterized protein n=1 Tax=Auriscalpium vulgare TaxID=40419 RepID=A0ACB8RQ47_9AGAM|nr:hypothetical protein FA95DRAFT_1560166 [Auriscalpium vulgare]